MLLLSETDLKIVFYLCLNRYFVFNNSVLPSPPLTSLSRNCDISPWKPLLSADVTLLDPIEVLGELQWLLRLTSLSPDLTP